MVSCLLNVSNVSWWLLTVPSRILQDNKLSMWVGNCAVNFSLHCFSIRSHFCKDVFAWKAVQQLLLCQAACGRVDRWIQQLDSVAVVIFMPSASISLTQPSGNATIGSFERLFFFFIDLMFHCASLSLQTTDDFLVASAECPSDDEDIDPCEPSSGGLG